MAVHDGNKRLKIAFLTSEDPQDRLSWSGITCQMAQALQKYCGDVYYLGPIITMEKRIAIAISRGTLFLFKKNIPHERLLFEAKKHSKIAAQRLAGRSFDLIFAPLGTVETAFLETDVPIVLAEGCTFNSMHNYYA